MNHKVISINELKKAGKWRAELFARATTKNTSTKWPAVQISEIATESTDAILPEELDGEQVLYVGLENVEPVTGCPVELLSQNKSNIRSRSKVFSANSILYGRLRPYLRKALISGEQLPSGICSTEFIVLIPKQEKVHPEFLRLLLVSKSITDQLARLQTGASLPRISSKDLFSLKVGLPPMEVQKTIINEYLTQKRRYTEALKVVSAFPDIIDDLVASC